MNRPEEAIQRAFVDLLHLTQPDCLWWHCPNGGGRSKAEGGIFKAMGVRPGVPDMHFLWKGRRIGFIEFKAEKGRLTLAQKMFRYAAECYGAEYEVCTTTEGAMAALESWGVMFKRRAA